MRSRGSIAPRGSRQRVPGADRPYREGTHSRKALSRSFSHRRALHLVSSLFLSLSRTRDLVSVTSFVSSSRFSPYDAVARKSGVSSYYPKRGGPFIRRLISISDANARREGRTATKGSEGTARATRGYVASSSLYFASNLVPLFPPSPPGLSRAVRRPRNVSRALSPSLIRRS